jgi:pyrrolidone-carboxylate peptidase
VTSRPTYAACARFLALAVLAAGCDDRDLAQQEDDVIVSTKTESEWQQYVANVAFVEGYRAACTRPEGDGRPRVLVTGFGRFLENRENATGRIVSRLVPGLAYPETADPAPGTVDEPRAQLAVAQGTIELPTIGKVDICGLILPVFWDVAAIVALREAEAFAPDLVVMNGIAGARQPLWLELGATNAAVSLPDGSGTLAPVEAGTPLVAEAGPSERARGNLLSWAEVREATGLAIAERAEILTSSGVPFGQVARGVELAGYPRESNTYLCNNTTYTLGYVLDHPGETVRLLEPSDPREGGPTGFDLSLAIDGRSIPRVFVHWPSELVRDAGHLDRAAEVLGALVAAQLGAASPPTRGDPSMADFTD